MKHFLLLTVLCSLFIAVSGCGKGKPEGFPAVVPCHITVTKSGQPLDKVVVMLSPSSGGGQWICSGTTNSNGVAEVSTVLSSYSQKGAPETEFKVFLTRPTQVETGVSEEDVIKMSAAEKAKLNKKMQKQIKAARIVPVILESIATTPLKIIVSKDKTVYNIELDDYK